MQPQTHQYYAPQYNPLHYQQQQQPRFDFTHPLEPFQAAHSSQFGNGPAGFHPVSAGGAHQPLAGPTHPQPSQHQARHPLRARSEVEALQQVHMNQFAGAAMEHARRSRVQITFNILTVVLFCTVKKTCLTTRLFPLFKKSASKAVG